jgi:hypothetical protein
VVLKDSSRPLCDERFPHRRAEVVANFVNAGPTALAKRRAEGTDPAHTEDARRRQGLRAAENARANRTWRESNPSPYTVFSFDKEVAIGLRAIPLSRMMVATGLSLRYCSLIRRGLKVPHPRHWQSLSELVVSSSQASADSTNANGKPQD